MAICDSEALLLSFSRSWALTDVPKTRDLAGPKPKYFHTKATETTQRQTEPEVHSLSQHPCSVEMKLDSAPGDMSEWREVDFALNCTYIVPDQVSDPSFSLPKAMTSIPRNLTFEYSTDNEVRTLLQRFKT